MGSDRLKPIDQSSGLELDLAVLVAHGMCWLGYVLGPLVHHVIGAIGEVRLLEKRLVCVEELGISPSCFTDLVATSCRHVRLLGLLASFTHSACLVGRTSLTR